MANEDRCRESALSFSLNEYIAEEVMGRLQCGLWSHGHLLARHIIILFVENLEFGKTELQCVIVFDSLAYHERTLTETCKKKQAKVIDHWVLSVAQRSPINRFLMFAVLLEWNGRLATDEENGVFMLYYFVLLASPLLDTSIASPLTRRVTVFGDRNFQPPTKYKDALSLEILLWILLVLPQTVGAGLEVPGALAAQTTPEDQIVFFCGIPVEHRQGQVAYRSGVTTGQISLAYVGQSYRELYESADDGL
ncbi:hypothetical protein VNI00_018789 [Paramarasmius palmivorus]|uniref:Uncharacterized protein n=1 Tax=Paramarasmius palmivorus TaxID=297713 RepID=A0AAW0ATB4_9AGAR